MRGTSKAQSDIMEDSVNFLEDEMYRSDIAAALENSIEFGKLKNKKILILGATGLIGSFLTDCLLYANRVHAMNMQIYAMSRRRQNLEARFGKEAEGLYFVEGDVMSLEAGMAPDVVIHAASYAYPRAFREKPVETMLANVVGTDNVLRAACRYPGCRVLYVSSGEVQEEVDHLSARACYPVSKKAGETLCISYIQEYQVDAVIARPCHTFGANVTSEDNRATAQFIACASKDQDIILKSSGKQMRSFAYVADCVSGLLTVLTCGKTGQVYGIAADEVCSIRQFAEKCAETVQRQVACVEANETEKAEVSPIKEQIIDNADLKSLGWAPAFSIEEGIRHSVMIQKGLS